MGIEIQSLKLLLLARQMGADFGRTLTIGRQDIFASRQQIGTVFARFGEPLTDTDAILLSGEDNRFSTGIFDRLGATQVDAMDISDFEGASIVQNLNEPLADALKGRFSTVFDGGTLEHVFDCPAAMRNYMMLPQVGGHLIVAVPSNNEMGHGFYQFSPEFFFRTLTPANGYRIKGLFLVPMFVDAPWLAVRDPKLVGGRVGDNHARRSTYVFVVAERTADTAIFAATPQQSDYEVEWHQPTEKARHGHRASAATLAKQRLTTMFPAGAIEMLLQVRALAKKPDPRLFTTFIPGSQPTPVLDQVVEGLPDGSGSMAAAG